MKTFEDGNIEIEYSEENEPCILELMNQVLIAYDTVTSLFNLEDYDKKIKIILYNNIEELHQDVFGERREDWGVACGDENGHLKLLTPLNPGKVHKYNDILKIAQKCVGDIIIEDSFKDIPDWLDITAYLFELMNSKITRHVPDIQNIQSFSDAYFVTRFLTKTFGLEKIVEIYENPKAYNKILGLTDEEIENQMIEFYK
ncbi:MAG TPA: hypothetical protein IAB70_00610 [Candidatus Merdicola faecigallinarum]|uniref:Uncharacterized protein n=1 Tax=Candidatus Merdicola faecigallinarum TaxID=2840862 RepID=A0A9D1LZU0_9FIRM|nr:hypothetical protein [Candidatus Merdicola faecigallinarum]